MPTPQEVLDTPMPGDGYADGFQGGTIRDFFVGMLLLIWGRDGANFSGKRPYSDSGWKTDVEAALIRAGHIEGTFDEDGFVETSDDKLAGKLIREALNHLGRNETGSQS